MGLGFFVFFACLFRFCSHFVVHSCNFLLLWSFFILQQQPQISCRTTWVSGSPHLPWVIHFLSEHMHEAEPQLLSGFLVCFMPRKPEEPQQQEWRVVSCWTLALYPCLQKCNKIFAYFYTIVFLRACLKNRLPVWSDLGVPRYECIF